MQDKHFFGANDFVWRGSTLFEHDLHPRMITKLDSNISTTWSESYFGLAWHTPSRSVVTLLDPTHLRQIRRKPLRNHCARAARHDVGVAPSKIGA